MVTPNPQQVIRVGGPEPAARAPQNPELARNFSVGSGDISTRAIATMGRRKPDSRTAKPDRSRLERRRLIVGVLCFLWFACIAARLYYFQVIQYVDLVSRAQRQQQRTIEVAPERGVIYDRQMNPLAMSLEVDSVFAVPERAYRAPHGGFPAGAGPEMDADVLRDRFQTARSFCWVKRRVTRPKLPACAS